MPGTLSEAEVSTSSLAPGDVDPIPTFPVFLSIRTLVSTVVCWPLFICRLLAPPSYTTLKPYALEVPNPVEAPPDSSIRSIAESSPESFAIAMFFYCITSAVTSTYL